jgi:hypothetical protein
VTHPKKKKKKIYYFQFTDKNLVITSSGEQRTFTPDDVLKRMEAKLSAPRGGGGWKKR